MAPGQLTLATLAIQALARCHADLLTARETVLSSRDVEGIHRTRVALRRIRAAGAFFGRALGNEKLLALRGDAKKLADACGATRDLDVFLSGFLKEAEQQLAAQADVAEQLRAFRTVAIRRRRRCHDAARQALCGEPFAGFEARLAQLIAVGFGGTAVASTTDNGSTPGYVEPAASPDDAPHIARDLLRKRDRKLRRGLAHVGDIDDIRRHELRLKVKRHRYVAEFLAPLFSRKAAPYVQQAARLQDALGLANDRRVAIGVIDAIRNGAQPKGRLDWIVGVLRGWQAGCAAAAEDDRMITSAVKRFCRAHRFWRHGIRPDRSHHEAEGNTDTGL